MANKDLSDYLLKEKCLCQDDVSIDIFTLSAFPNDFEKDELAKYIRNHYLNDERVSSRALFVGCSFSETIKKYVLPNIYGKPPGPSVASGEFGEILCSDILSKFYGFVIPRYKLFEKPSPDTPVTLADIMGYQTNDTTKSTDVLCFAEVKTSLSGKDENTMLNALEEAKTKLMLKERQIQTMIFYINKARLAGDEKTVHEIERFAPRPDNQYDICYFALSVSGTEDCPSIDKLGVSGKSSKEITLVHVYGTRLLEFEKELYTRYK